MAYQGQTMAAKKKASSGEDLTALPGVGAATAKKLQAASFEVRMSRNAALCSSNNNK